MKAVPMNTVPVSTATANTVPFARDLALHGDRAAFIMADGEVSYRDLAVRVDEMSARLGRERRLVLLAGSNTIDAVVTYLGALAAGHPVVLVPGDHPGAIDNVITTYDPDVVVRGVGHLWRIDERRATSRHMLHPDLALLLSTSGSTGSPKLVRLSHDNLQANAEAIASYLAIDASDRAATTLPMHYCYGLSVINSHLLRGASLILTDLSVTDPGFWDLFGDHHATTFAAVPYTFELLDRIGFDTMRLPHLRRITQAGGRLAPDRVRRYAALGRRDGWDLVVMYGQTEATARMAYLPPDLALSHPHCIGIPIPDGSFRLAPLADWPGDDTGDDTGELVYNGPNVMLGYAESTSDLFLGRTVDELHTGDIARRTSDGLYELVGRRDRFAKIFGLRIDLGRVEAMLEAYGVSACCVGHGDRDDELVVAVTGDADAARLKRLVARECGLPPHAVRVCVLPELPRLPNGKPDNRAVEATAAATRAHVAPRGADGTDLCRLFADVLGHPGVTPDSTFVSLGGDSLSYVEMSIRLERALGHLPTDWHTTPIRDLRQAASRRTRARWLETSVALRAISIVLIVGTHAQLFAIAGGAHLLLSVAGFNFARFHLTSADRRERSRGMGASIWRILLPSVAWICLVLLLTNKYALENVLLVTYIVGPTGRHNDFWFIEALLYNLVVLCAVLAIPLVDRVERRFPFGLPVALMALGLVTRYQLVPGVHLRTPAVVFWLVCLGWAAAKATNVWQRLLVTVAIATTSPGFFGDLQREAVMMVGLTLMVWIPAVPSVQPLNRVAGVLAGSSLYIYLVHWQVYPYLSDTSPLLAVAASLGAGIGLGALTTRATAAVSTLHRRRYEAGQKVA